MRVQLDNGSVTSNLTSGQTAFTIQANAQAFAALYTNIYTNKPMAVVREIMCNARDAHLVAGQTRPIEIHTPNTLQPSLDIRDYGPGMSHRKIVTLACSMFASDKGDRDELTGGFGVGSKSPFAVSKQYSTTSIVRRKGWTKGIKSVYVMYLSDTGFPTCQRVSRELTEEPSGVSVSVPISGDNWYRYESAAGLFLNTFDFPVELNGVRVEPLQLPTSALKLSNGAAIFHASYLSKEARGSSVIQAGVRYQMPSEDDLQFPAGTWVIVVPPGSVQPALSREHLSVTRQTKDFLLASIEEMKERYYSETVKSLEGAPNFFAAVEWYSDSMLAYFAPKDAAQPTWRGFSVWRHRDERAPSVGTFGLTARRYYVYETTKYRRGRYESAINTIQGTDALYCHDVPTFIWSAKPRNILPFLKLHESGFRGKNFMQLVGPEDKAREFLATLGLPEAKLELAQDYYLPPNRTSTAGSGKHLPLVEFSDRSTAILSARKVENYSDVVLSGDWLLSQLREMQALRCSVRQVVEYTRQGNKGRELLLRFGASQTFEQWVEKHPEQVDWDRVAYVIAVSQLKRPGCTVTERLRYLQHTVSTSAQAVHDFDWCCTSEWAASQLELRLPAGALKRAQKELAPLAAHVAKVESFAEEHKEVLAVLLDLSWHLVEAAVPMFDAYFATVAKTSRRKAA
jgi:hypothetical protein